MQHHSDTLEVSTHHLFCFLSLSGRKIGAVRIQLAEHHCQQFLAEGIDINLVDVFVFYQLQHLVHLALQSTILMVDFFVRSEHDTYQHPENHCHEDENQVACC